MTKYKKLKNLTIMNMVIRYFENHTLFCKNKLYEKMDAQLVPKNENKIRTIRRSNQFFGNKSNIYFIPGTLSYKSCKVKL